MRMPGRALAVAASASYLGSCALGVLATARRGSTRRVRWLHHALYVSTFALTGAAAGAALIGREPAGRPLAAATAPLTLISAFSGRSRAHRIIAASAAPFYAATLTLLFSRKSTR